MVSVRWSESALRDLEKIDYPIAERVVEKAIWYEYPSIFYKRIVTVWVAHHARAQRFGVPGGAHTACA